MARKYFCLSYVDTSQKLKEIQNSIIEGLSYNMLHWQIHCYTVTIRGKYIVRGMSCRVWQCNQVTFAKTSREPACISQTWGPGVITGLPDSKNSIPWDILSASPLSWSNLKEHAITVTCFFEDTIITPTYTNPVLRWPGLHPTFIQIGPTLVSNNF